MSAWDETALEQACRVLPAQVRRLKGRNRREAQDKLLEILVALKRLAERVIEVEIGSIPPPPPASQPEAAKAFAEATRIATAPIRRAPSGTYGAVGKTEPPEKK